MKHLLRMSAIACVLSTCAADRSLALETAGLLPTAVPVPPVVIMLIDNSAGMAAISTDAGYRPDGDYPRWEFRPSDPATALVEVDGPYLDVDTLSTENCPPGYTRGNLDGRHHCLRLPASIDGGRLYELHYLRYLFHRFDDGTDLTATAASGNAVIPQRTRFAVLRESARRVVQNLGDVSVCMATLDPGGGLEIAPACSADRQTLLERIDTLQVRQGQSSPLATAYHDAIRWLQGQPALDGTSRASPLGFRCQGAGILFFTDGHATADDSRNYSVINPGDGTWPPGGKALPDWDQRHPPTSREEYTSHRLPAFSDGFGGNPGRGGSFLFLDDIAGFGRQIDLLGATQTDRAGISHGAAWSPAVDSPFRHQFLVGYMISPLGSGPVLDEAGRAAGGAHVSARDSSPLARSLARALHRHHDGAATLTPPVVHITQGGGLLVYRATYEPLTWSGSLDAFRITAEDLSANNLPHSPLWSARDGIPTPETRRIFTARPPDATRGESGPKVGIPFQWEALDPGQRAALQNDPALLRWVRGSSSDSRANGGPYRDRITPLDAFTHSAPVLLPKEPPGNYPDSDHRTYRESRVLHAAEPVLFAADNGGLLHAFRAGPDGGEELFAYLPSSLMSRLFTLATKATGYLPILDGLLVVEDARLGDPDIANPWRTVLLGSLGRGGAGIYALDVTRAGDPGAEIPAGELLMWEIDSRFPRRTENGSPAYPHLGELHSPVSVIRTGDSQGDQGWFALIPNGLHSSSGATVLYLADLADGSLYQEIILSADGGGGLRSATAVDLDGNSTTDRVYAGDHHGRVWRLDWNADTRRFQSRYTAGGEPTPLFQAQVDGTGGAASKPIDGGFAISTLAGRAAEDATIVHFGTVAEHPLTNGLYAIWDSNDVPLTGADRLMQRQFRESEVAGTRVRTVEGEPFQYQEDGIRGWVVDLPLAGEFLAGTPSRFHDRLLFSTRTFSDPARTDPCEIRPSGWLMEVDALSGLEPGTAVLDLNGDGRIDDSDLASGRSVPGGVESGEESPVPPVFERMPGNTEPGLIRLEGGTGGSVTARALPLRLRRFAWRRRE